LHRAPRHAEQPVPPGRLRAQENEPPRRQERQGNESFVVRDSPTRTATAQVPYDLTRFEPQILGLATLAVFFPLPRCDQSLDAARIAETSVSSSGKAGWMPVGTSVRQALSKTSFRGSRFHREIGRSGVVRVFVVRAERRDAVTVQASNGAARIETLNFSPRTAPDHAISLSSLAGSSPRGIRMDAAPGVPFVGTERRHTSFCKSGCDSAAQEMMRPQRVRAH
jgi:hypothetical protein